MHFRALPIASLLLVLCCGISSASPIEESIDSPAALAAAGVKMDARRSTDGKPTITFKVTWTPASKSPDPSSPNSMWLNLCDKDETGAIAGGPFTPARFTSHYPANRNGQCQADFTIAETELPSAELWLLIPQETIYRIQPSAYRILTGLATAAGNSAEEERFDKQITGLLKKELISQLGKVHTIVLADFIEPQGTVITRVIRGGDNVKTGQPWNSVLFPRGPILIYERGNDLIGNATGDISATGYYPLDETKTSISRETTEMETGRKQNHLIPLDDILKVIGASANPGSSGSGQSSSRGEPSDKPSPPPAK